MLFPPLARPIALATLAAVLLLVGCANQPVLFSARVPASVPTDPQVAHSAKTFLYVPNMLSDTISAFTLDATSGNLTPISGSPLASPIPRPFSLAPRPQSDMMLIVNNNDGVWASYDNIAFALLDRDTGALQPQTTQSILEILLREVTWDKSGRFAYANRDGGLLGFSFQPNLSLDELPRSDINLPVVPNAPLLHPTGNWIYTDNGSAIYAFSRDATTGELQQIQAVPSQIGSLAMTPDGSYLVGSFWNQSTVASYSIDPGIGTVELASKLNVPGPPAQAVSTITVHPSGQYVVQMIMSNNPLHPAFPGQICVFHLDSESGTLSEVAGSPFPAGTSPYTGTFDPSGSWLYVVDRGPSLSQDEPSILMAYSFDRETGTLKALPNGNYELGVGAALPIAVGPQ